jgi:hypothetical protein
MLKFEYWKPGLILAWSSAPGSNINRLPCNAKEHFIVNSAHRAIMRAMVSSRVQSHKSHK